MPKILTLDADAGFLNSIGKELSQSGFEVLAASNRLAAQTLVLKTRPDLIVMDIALHDHQGAAFLHWLRSKRETAALPVIILTELAARTQVVEAARNGVKDYILKKFVASGELRKRIAQRFPPVVCAGGGSLPIQAKSPSPQIPQGSLPILLTREECIARAEKAMEGKALSGVVAQVVTMAGSPRTDTAQLVALIAKDPMLAARVLHASNSAAYRSARGPVTSLVDAIRQIGCSTVRNIAATLGVAAAMPAADPDGFNPTRCWQHSFAVALLCEKLFSQTKNQETSAGIPYLVGLCHDLGEILFHTKFGPEYRQVLEIEKKTHESRDKLVRTMLGVGQGELVLTILRDLGLPETIRAPIEALHVPNRAKLTQNDPMVGLLRLANSYATGMLLASSGTADLNPILKSECRPLLGQDNPPIPDAEQMRAEIFTMTAMLSRGSSEEDQHLMAPMWPSSPTKIWLTRDSGFSKFDPIEAALSTIASVKVAEKLPVGEELADLRGLVVVSRDTGVSNLRDSDIHRAILSRSGLPIPTLWLVGRHDPAVGAPKFQPVLLPTTIDSLAAFVQSAATQQQQSVQKVA